MSRFVSLVGFELRYYLGRLSTWVYLLVLAGLAFLMVNLLGGAFPEAQAAVGGSDGKVLVNSPFVIALLTANVSLFAILVTAALAGHAGYRDFGAGQHPLVFTTPVSKWSWLGSRYVGTVLVNLIVLSGIGLGLWLGSLVPWIEADQFGANSLGAYLAPYATLILPNLAFTAAIFLALAALTRERLPHYAAGVFLLIGYILASALAGDVDNKLLASLADPFGFQAIVQTTEYWTTVEKNAQTIPLAGLVLANRALWLSVTALVVLGATALFRFQQEALLRIGRRRTAPAPELAPPAPSPVGRITLPPARRRRGLAAALPQYRTTLRRAFSDVIANAYFVAILLAGVLFLIFGATQVGKIFGTTTFPVTYQVLEILGGLFALFIVIVITFYAGELVWQERDLRVDQVVDATPSPSWVPYLAKGTALGAVVACLLGVLLVAGMATQLARGYTNLEPGLYLKFLYGFQLPDYLLLCVLALAVHALVNHKYVGHFIMVLHYGFNAFRGQMGLEHVLYGYGSDLGQTYSDMNRFGWFTEPYVWFKLFWGGVALLLAIASNLLWVRGQETRAAWRLSLARLRFRRPAVALTLVAAALALGVGGFIFYNTNVLHEYRTSFEVQELFARYERDYKRHEALPQPRITAVSVDVDIWPERGDFGARGRYDLVNRTDEPIEAVHVRVNPDGDVRRLDFTPAATLEHDDAELGYRIYRLAEPLAPGAAGALDFEILYPQRGFSAGGVNTRVVGNGTFIHSNDTLPAFGYDAGGELADDRTRKRHDLPPKERMRDLDDPEGRRNTYISSDADWVDFEATVSTSPDQVAIAPGYLQREWMEDGRRHFHYTMDAKILNFFSFLSARYAVERDVWTDPEGTVGHEVAIEVWHHPGHEYNVKRMIEGVKASLDYYSREFSPYQHRQVRILEFPRYATFAQSFPNTIPYSESIGFIADVGEEDVDYPFYVTAHEVAHQWWAHQVIGANVQGATVLSETLSQYAALMVMEHDLGPAQMTKFLKYELDAYLQGRAFEKKKELPLLRCENQQYIHYRKGSQVMYQVKELLGEEAVNGALRGLIGEFAFQGPPYPTSRDLLRHLRAAAGPEHQQALTDLFEHVTLYTTKAVSATSRKLDDGRYEVTFGFEAGKLHAGELGEEAQAPLRDWIEVGAWGFGKDPIYLEKHLIEEGQTSVTFVVDQYPERVAIDPRHVLIDRHPDDNEVKVGAAAAAAAGGDAPVAG